MVRSNDMEFATSVAVMFKLKEYHGCKTLQETYKLFEEEDNIDIIFETLCVAYNKQNGTDLSIEQLLDKFAEKEMGFLAITDLFQEVVEKLMYDGLSGEKLQAKKAMVEQMSKK